MAKPVISTEPPTMSEANGHVSSTVEMRKTVRKEANFREWLVANQIGMESLLKRLLFEQRADTSLF